MSEIEANERYTSQTSPDDLIETPEEHAERIAGFKPSPSRVIPSEQCSYVRKDGSRCRAWALRGTTVCLTHGARIPAVREAAARRVEEARIQLGLSAPRAANLLVEQVEDPEVPSYVRQRAAIAVLDRVGIGPNHKSEVEVSGSIEHTHSVEAASRIHGALDRYAAISAETEAEVIEAEVVEDSP